MPPCLRGSTTYSLCKAVRWGITTVSHIPCSSASSKRQSDCARKTQRMVQGAGGAPPGAGGNCAARRTLFEGPLATRLVFLLAHKFDRRGVGHASQLTERALVPCARHEASGVTVIPIFAAASFTLSVSAQTTKVFRHWQACRPMICASPVMTASSPP